CPWREEPIRRTLPTADRFAVRSLPLNGRNPPRRQLLLLGVLVQLPEHQRGDALLWRLVGEGEAENRAVDDGMNNAPFDKERRSVVMTVSCYNCVVNPVFFDHCVTPRAGWLNTSTPN